jgi:hypothetical protein
MLLNTPKHLSSPLVAKRLFGKARQTPSLVLEKMPAVSWRIPSPQLGGVVSTAQIVPDRASIDSAPIV